MALEAPYSVGLLTEYTHTLDALPIDLSRNFADLRELDAVLSTSVLHITAKIKNLTTMIEQGQVSKEDKLWLLTEIADEAQRLKLGGEDKIRVACQAADNLKSHSNHLRLLAEHLPGFDTSVLERKTTYPHISDRSYQPPMTLENTRRRRGANAGQLSVANATSTSNNNNVEPSPVKRKRAHNNRDDDGDVGRTPKKPVVAESNARSRTNARAKKTERAESPSESLLSVTSHLPQQGTRGGSNAANSRSANASTSNKRVRSNANNNRNPTPLAYEAYQGPHDVHPQTHNNSSRRGANNNGTASNNNNTNNSNVDSYNLPPASGHPSLPNPYQNGTSNGAGNAQGGYDAHGMPLNSTSGAGAQDWNLPHPQQLEGPGMPVARSTSLHSTAANTNAISPIVEADDGDGDGDDKTYCFCNGVSYGEMIACDDKSCEREWFHWTCIGLTVPPDGAWYCKTCEPKHRNVKKPGRGGKRKAGGGRANAKS